MKFKYHISLLLICILAIIIIVTGCKKEPEVLEPPTASFSINPPNGNTTTNFVFDASSTQIPEDISEVLYRWDWDGDNIWDTPFSKSKIIIHRYFIEGSYIPQLEVRALEGLSDTLQINVQVVQGYSPPVAKFNFTPDFGHILTTFYFDASECRDDEDSISSLLFRWDWEGDGIWDTDFDSNPAISHQFLAPEFYNVTMQVKDPSNLANMVSHGIEITLHNPAIFVDFTIVPEEGTNDETFTFDASASKDLENTDNNLWYRWTCKNKEGVIFWRTDYLDDPVVTHIFSFLETGEKIMTLEVQDTYGLTNSTLKEFNVLLGNIPPVASFFIGCPHGNTSTEFYFDASAVTDNEDYTKDLKIRWDFNNDGTWDTEYSTDKTINHNYDISGEKHVTMEVIDSEGETDTFTSGTIMVSDGTNETGLLLDTREPDKTDYYGTVKIGNQWWTSQNINRGSYFQTTVTKMCYRNIPSNCEKYGALYTFWNAMLGNYQLGARGVCPDGWHIPTPDDFDTLIEFLGDSIAGTELQPGGSSDFYLQYAGFKDVDGTFRFLGTYATFWTSRRTNSTSSNAWSYSIKSDENTFQIPIISGNYGHSIRCIKN